MEIEIQKTQESPRRCNGGSFKKGNAPWNKGVDGAGTRKGEYAAKGHRGFLKRPVLAIARDGSVLRRFGGVEECRRWLGLRDGHSVTNACKGIHRCRGLLLMYEEDWSPLGDYHSRATPERDIYGHFITGAFLRRAWRGMSDGKRAALRETAARTAKRLNATPGSNFGRQRASKPVACLDTGRVFATAAEAAAWLGAPRCQVYSAMRRRGTVRGRRLAYLDATAARQRLEDMRERACG